MEKGPSGPPDAEKLPDEEARYYIDNLQGALRHCVHPREGCSHFFAGLWEIKKTDIPDDWKDGSWMGARRTLYTRVNIANNKATYSDDENYEDDYTEVCTAFNCFNERKF